MSTLLKLGIIGLSPGNGHPYSWSAIFNGYDPAIMEKCGFPVIPRYLEKQSFPDDTISEATVTHIWTQDMQLSRHIAKATNIENVVENLNDLIENVDGVLLARDDAETHLEIAQPFLEAGLPIYIDKPLALSVAEAEKLLCLQQYPGQIFSCSALRYAPEMRLTQDQIKNIGKIISIWAFSSKDWDKYSIHLIEPLLRLIPDCGEVRRSQKWLASDRTLLMIEFVNGVEAQIHTLGRIDLPLSLHVIGDKGSHELVFKDTFRAFRGALREFVLGILHGDVRISSEDMLNSIKLVELGKIF
jgi:predicted dehydrogenase